MRTQGVFSDWTRTVTNAGGAAVGTWALLEAAARMRSAARLPLIASALAVTGIGAVATTWARPDLPAPYAQSAFSDLGAAVFVTGAVALLALVAAGRGLRAAGKPPA